MGKIRYDNIISGNRLEVCIYPTHEKSGIRLSEGPKTNKTKEQMQAENDKKATLKFVRLCECNFSTKDFKISCEYEPEFAPADEKALHKDISNYIRRIKYYRKKKGLSNKNFKYNLSVHCELYKSGYKCGLKHYHFHGFISGDGMTSEEMKGLWKYGTKGNIERYDPIRYEPDDFAYYAATGTSKGRKYIRKGSRRFIHSQNCKQPIVQPKKDARINKEKLAEIAEKRVDDRSYWEKKYPSYYFKKMDVQYNQFNGFYYVRVVLYKKDLYKVKGNTYFEKSRKVYTDKC